MKDSLHRVPGPGSDKTFFEKAGMCSLVYMSLRCLRGKSFISFFRRPFLSTIICYCRPLIAFQNSLDPDQARSFAAREESVCFKRICRFCWLSYSSVFLAGMQSCAVSYLIANSARNESELQRHFLSNHLSILCLLLFCPQSSACPLF